MPLGNCLDFGTDYDNINEFILCDLMRPVYQIFCQLYTNIDVCFNHTYIYLTMTRPQHRVPFLIFPQQTISIRKTHRIKCPSASGFADTGRKRVDAPRRWAGASCCDFLVYKPQSSQRTQSQNHNSLCSPCPLWLIFTIFSYHLLMWQTGASLCSHCCCSLCRSEPRLFGLW